MSHRCAFKVSIIGCGRVGMTAAYALLLKGIPTDLVLYARKKEEAVGEQLDLEHGLPFMEKANITGTNDLADVAGSNVILYTSGAAQEPGESRLDLTKKNVAILEKLMPELVKVAPEATYIMVANPVDILTYHAQQIAQLPTGRIFGSGTLLDTARFRFHLSEALHVNSRSIHTYILGEHGDTSFPTLHSASIGGQPLATFPGYTPAVAAQALEATRQAANRIIAGKGATYYAIGTALTHLVRAINRDSLSVVPASLPLQDYYGVSNVALSVPCILGRQGISQRLKIDLSPEEVAQLQHSASTLQQYL
jgi:L-lactate dehydrogenase